MTKKKLAYLVSSAALLGSASLFPAFASEVTVSGNGAFSDNHVRVSERSETSLSQSNNTSISNNVSSRSNTGNNSASFNTGGNNSIHTGDANSDVSIHNIAGVNYANVGGHENNDHDKIEVKHNGAFSDNSVNFSDEDTKNVDQNNHTRIDNNVDSKSDTGSNHADGNTWYKQKDNKDWENEQKDWSDNNDKKDEYKSDNKSYDHKDFSMKNDWNYNQKDDHNQYAYLQNCNAYLNFVYKHEGYNGDWGCQTAYEYYMNHKDDHSYSKTSYNHDKNYITYVVKKYDDNCNSYDKKDYGRKDNYKYQSRGGNVSIHTGNASSTVRIANAAGFNYASY